MHYLRTRYDFRTMMRLIDCISFISLLISSGPTSAQKFGKIPYAMTENQDIRDILPAPENADRASQRKEPEQNIFKPYDFIHPRTKNHPKILFYFQIKHNSYKHTIGNVESQIRRLLRASTESVESSGSIAGAGGSGFVRMLSGDDLPPPPLSLPPSLMTLNDLPPLCLAS